MTEPDISYISPSVLFRENVNDDDTALYQPLPMESHRMDLDPPNDQILDSEFPWSVPGVFGASLESEGRTPQTSHKCNGTLSPRIATNETWHSQEYDHRGEIATCYPLTHSCIQSWTGQFSGHHVITAVDNPPLLESLMDFDFDLSLDMGGDFSLDALTAPAQVNNPSEPQDPTLPIPHGASSDRSEVVSDIPKDARRFDKTQLDTLNKWVAACTVPYPTRKEKLSLAGRTGLKINQITSWFSRVRQKMLRGTYPKPLQTIHSTTPLPMIDIILPPLLNSYEQGFRVSQLSLPIAFAKHIPPGVAIRRSRSLPLHFTLDHLQKQPRHLPVRWSQRGSLDVVLSKHTDRSSLSSEKDSMNTLRPQGSRENNYFPLQYHLKQSYVIEWLNGLPDNVTELASLQRDETRPTSFDSLPTNPLNHDDYWLPWPRSDSSLGSHRHGLDKNEAGDDLQDSASIAWSAGMSGSSGSSHQSFGSLGSRKGRRIFTHVNSSSESGSIRKRGREAFKEETRRTKKSRPSRFYPPSSYHEGEERATKQRKYYCTFCISVFKDPVVWQRHEESVHAPRQEWICGPNESSCHTPAPYNMSTRPDSATDLATPPCPLCKEMAVYPATDCIEVSDTCPHGFSECWAKPQSARTFYRRESLHQHLTNVHAKIKGHSTLVKRLNLNQWLGPVKTSGYDLKCHFCGAPNSRWSERCDHIRAHFEDGMTMDQWQPRYVIDYNQPENISTPSGHKQDGIQPFQVFEYVEGNLYVPQWCRQTKDGLEGWCGLCRPGRWFRFCPNRFKYDRSIKHGISMKTGTSYPEPSRTRWSITHGIEGLCAQCDSWITLERTPLGDESWLTHSFLVSTASAQTQNESWLG
ncbi:hypothetical protein RRF57_009545 [Xylaria bambusicola]|uniref:Homeobox domain-containing protein n=1 Tax=Xylaria bambusicola TaxID=326684 RepID=A0AAN7ZC09_9PEZI